MFNFVLNFSQQAKRIIPCTIIRHGHNIDCISCEHLLFYLNLDYKDKYYFDTKNIFMEIFFFKIVVQGGGIEPPFAEPKSAVLSHLYDP